MQIPDIRYAKTPDGTYIAFQTFGAGPIDLLLIPGYFSNLDENWSMPGMVDFHERLGAFARVIAVDRRGVGLSDRLPRGTREPLETHVDDLLAVLDAVHAAPQVCVLATESATALATLVAAGRPDRERALVLYQPLPAALYLYEVDPDTDAYDPDDAVATWGSGFAQSDFDQFAPSVAGDPAIVAAWARYLRASASPGSAISVFMQSRSTDVTSAFAAIQAPTLLILRTETTMPASFRQAADSALDAIPDVRLVELPGRDVPYWIGDRTAVLAEIERFFAGTRTATAPTPSRGLATILFTDIVGSTERAAALGDERWAALLAAHRRIVRASLDAHGGIEVDTAGDGFLAVFDGPARAVHAALEATEAMEPLGLELRAGVHTGEVERDGTSVVGLAVHIGARIASVAGASEVVVSQTVKDLAAGSDLRFDDAGEHELKGVPGPWRLYRAAGEVAPSTATPRVR
jgi:class 3 adenylate cyclase